MKFPDDFLCNFSFQPFGESTLKCKVRDATGYFEAAITEVRFTDGTVWKNF